MYSISLQQRSALVHMHVVYAGVQKKLYMPEGFAAISGAVDLLKNVEPVKNQQTTWYAQIC